MVEPFVGIHRRMLGGRKRERDWCKEIDTFEQFLSELLLRARETFQLFVNWANLFHKSSNVTKIISL